MATGIYIGATSSYAGKNMLALGLGLRFQKEGYSVGYLKPVGAMPTQRNGVMGDEDAFFMRDVLQLDDAPESLCPVLITQDFRVQALTGETPDRMPEIRAAYERLAAKYDVVIVAGSGNVAAGRYCGLDGLRIIRELDLHAVLIDRYQRESGYDTLMLLRDTLQERLAGVVLNDIPKSFLSEIETLITPCLERNETRVLGVLQRDPLMNAITVGDLAECLNSRIISATDRADLQVENFLIATMQVENFITHMRNHQKSAIFVGGDRADIQLLAIEGGCPCLVLTGNLYPSDIILTRSEIHHVPIIVVRDDTYAVAKKMEQILIRHKLRDDAKTCQAARLVENSLDLPRLLKAVGLK